jgi:hypothetical protein
MEARKQKEYASSTVRDEPRHVSFITLRHYWSHHHHYKDAPSHHYYSVA